MDMPSFRLPRFKYSRRVRILCYACVCLAILYYCYMRESYDIRNRISEILGDDKIAVCQFGDFTRFQWSELYLSWFGLPYLAGRLEMDFTDDAGEHKTVFLPLLDYYVNEFYVSHSPVDKRITQKSFALLSNTEHLPFSPKNSIHIQLLDYAGFFFINEALSHINNGSVKISTTTDVAWDSMKITHFEQQYYYRFEFIHNGSLVLSFSLPCNVIKISDNILKDRSGVMNSDNIISFSIKNDLILVSLQ